MALVSNWILGLDGGGSSSSARLVNTQTNEQWQVISGPVSLTNNYELACHNIQSMCDELFNLAGCKSSEICAHFGAAGACDDTKLVALLDHFRSQFCELHISSDATTSAFGANNGAPVVVVALGTGSVAMRLERNGETVLIGGWGFLLGDEGGGAKLGLTALKCCVVELEQPAQPMSALSTLICGVVGKNRTEVANWVVNAKPADYAVFAKSIFELNNSCKQATKLIKQHVIDVEELITRSRDIHQLPVVLMGGLSEATSAQLSPDIKKLVIQGVGNALDGACILATETMTKHNQLALTPLNIRNKNG